MSNKIVLIHTLCINSLLYIIGRLLSLFVLNSLFDISMFFCDFRRVFGRKTEFIQKLVAGYPIKMRSNRSRTARNRHVSRSRSATGLWTVERGRLAGGTEPSEPCRSRCARRVRGRFAGSSGPSARHGPGRLRLGQGQNARSRQANRKMVHVGRAKRPLRTPERDDVWNDVRDSGRVRLG